MLVLLADARQQGGQLFKGVHLLGRVQVDAGDGAAQVARQQAGDDQRANQAHGQTHAQPWQHVAEQQVRHLHGGGQAQHAAVLQPQGVVHHILPQSAGVAHGGAAPLAEGLDELRPVGVVLHCLGVRRLVIVHMPVRRNPGDPAVGDQAVEKVRADALFGRACTDEGRLLLQAVDDPALGGYGQHRADHQRKQQAGQQRYHDEADKNAFLHGAKSSLLALWRGLRRPVMPRPPDDSPRRARCR